MKRSDDKFALIEKAFRHEHGKRQACTVTPEWERNVMSHIFSLHAMSLQNVKTLWDAPVIWRTAVAVSISALIILASTLLSNAGAEYDAARFLLDDPVAFIFTQPFFP